MKVVKVITSSTNIIDVSEDSVSVNISTLVLANNLSVLDKAEQIAYVSELVERMAENEKTTKSRPHRINAQAFAYREAQGMFADDIASQCEADLAEHDNAEEL